jgi:hypothetical protein
MRTSRVTSRKVDLALSALASQHRHHPPHRDAQPIGRKLLAAPLIGNNSADPIYQIGQIIIEIELGGIVHEPGASCGKSFRLVQFAAAVKKSRAERKL